MSGVQRMSDSDIREVVEAMLDTRRGREDFCFGLLQGFAYAVARRSRISRAPRPGVERGRRGGPAMGQARASELDESHRLEPSELAPASSRKGKANVRPDPPGLSQSPAGGNLSVWNRLEYNQFRWPRTPAYWRMRLRSRLVGVATDEVNTGRGIPQLQPGDISATGFTDIGLEETDQAVRRQAGAAVTIVASAGKHVCGSNPSLLFGH